MPKLRVLAIISIFKRKFDVLTSIFESKIDQNATCEKQTIFTSGNLFCQSFRRRLLDFPVKFRFLTDFSLFFWLKFRLLKTAIFSNFLFFFRIFYFFFEIFIFFSKFLFFLPEDGNEWVIDTISMFTKKMLFSKMFDQFAQVLEEIPRAIFRLANVTRKMFGSQMSKKRNWQKKVENFEKKLKKIQNLKESSKKKVKKNENLKESSKLKKKFKI